VRVSDLPISEGLRVALEEAGIVELFPPQEEAVRAGLLEGENLLVTTPTASGKTLLAVLAADVALANRKKVVYLTPLRALTWEKAEYFSSLLGVDVAAASGDLDADASYLSRYDVIVATYEKMDSVIRHGAPWLGRVGLIAVDEVHMIGDRDRGATLEVVTARLREIVPDAQLLALSATVTNADQLASFLGTKVVRSDWRPTRLVESVYDVRTSSLLYADGTKEKVPVLHSNPSVSLALWTVRGGGQSMIFAPSRKLAEDFASEVADALWRSGFRPDRRVEEYASQLSGTDLDEILSRLMVKGAAFHHAGLSAHQRRVVEAAFRERLLPVVVATPTLAAGVNIPARTVVIPDLRKGAESMTVMEYKQLAGRAGRPGYDEAGLSIVVARSSKQAHEYLRGYVRAEPEPVASRLADPRSIRFHVLALVATEGLATPGDLRRFFSETLAARQDPSVLDRIPMALRWLEAVGMLRRRSAGYVPTRIGRTVARLYVMPETAITLLKGMRTLLSGDMDDEERTFRALVVVCSSPDVPEVPGLQVTLNAVYQFSDEVPVSVLARSLVLKAWIDEVSEQEIYRTYNAAPGDLYVLREASSWVARAGAELAAVIGAAEHRRLFDELSRRLEHGVRPELLDLCSVPDIGRVRARILYAHGIRTVGELLRTPPSKLASLPMFGPDLARRILSRLNMVRAEVGGDVAA